jgi:transcriptional regulator with XRE-family HTH domain
MQWSQERFADELGMRQPAVSKIEKAKSLPKTDTLIRLAIVLGCSVEDLLEGVDASYDAMIKTIRVVQFETVRAEQHRVNSILPENTEGSHAAHPPSADLDTLRRQHHEALAAAVALIRVLLGPAAEIAGPDAAAPRRSVAS